MFSRRVGPGIEMRLMQVRDAEPMFAVVERNREYLRTWLPWVDATDSPAVIREFIRGAVEKYRAGLALNAAVWIDGGIAGSVGHHAIDRANRSTSLGYWIDEAHQGKGIITRCCRVLLDYLFDEQALHRVEIRCGTGNLRSCAIPERLGFTREGVLREAEWVSGRFVDLVVWGMLEDEWRARRATSRPL
jgi:ribosomal-protein-serine acetyltransferase